MKYIKTYEKITKLEEMLLIDKIKTVVTEATYPEYFIEDKGDFADTSFDTELALIQQKNYIKDIYDDIALPENISLIYFKKTYKKLLNDAYKTILKHLEDDPSLYSEYLDDYLEVPDWIKKAGKYNL
jgi:hypothetical protein